MDKRFKILGVGSPLVDNLARVEDDFLAGIGGAKGGMELIEADGVQTILGRLEAAVDRIAGGSAANTVTALARLGVASTFLGKVGSDEAVDVYLDGFRTAGVDVSRFKRHATTPTGQCLCLITPDSERTCRTFLGAAGTLTPEELSPADFADVEHVHIEGYMLFNQDLAWALLKTAREAGCRISLDLASFEVVHANRDIMDEILAEYVDMVFANEEESAAYCGSESPETGLAALARHCDTAVVKIGAKGAWLQSGTEQARVEAEVVEAIDTTGAGDLWAAGFLFGVFAEHDLATCGRLGARLGAEVVQVLGAGITDERWQQLKKELHQT